MNAALRLSIKQWAPQDRPSDKLQNLGAEQMSDAELISLLVGCGTAQQSAVDVANKILRKFGNNLNALGKARFDELEDIEGVGVQTACKIMAAVELGRRRQMAAAEPKPDMGTAVRIYNYMFPRMRDLQTEEFHILLMNQNYRLIKSVRISQGGITENMRKDSPKSPEAIGKPLVLLRAVRETLLRPRCACVSLRPQPRNPLFANQIPEYEKRFAEGV